jgi:uncharacterized repeat protein (TIGR01451 family)
MFFATEKSLYESSSLVTLATYANGYGNAPFIEGVAAATDGGADVVIENSSFGFELDHVALNGAITNTGVIVLGQLTILPNFAPLTGAGKTISATEGATFSGPVATFTDPSGSAAAGDLTAYVNWGDDTNATGTVTGPDATGVFTVTGSHTYAEEGTDQVSITLASNGAPIGTFQGTAQVSDASLTAEGTIVNATEGNTFSGTVANFIDDDPQGNLADYAALIDWGDGTITPGTITVSGGGFAVSGSHLYNDESTQPVIVSIADAGGATATATSTAVVSDFDTLLWTPAIVSSTEGTAFSGVVATFTNLFYTANPASDFDATINWGDGTTDAGTITGTGGEFTVTGSHIYADEGSYSYAVTLADDAPGTASATALGTATVTDNDTLEAGSATLVAAEGTTFTGAVATFTDTTYPGNSPADFNATIDWGDGTTDAGTVTDGNGTLTVSGSHLYADEGPNPLKVSLSDDDPGTGWAIAEGTATVDDNDMLVPGAPVVAKILEGGSVSGALATFTDPSYAENPASDFSAAIAWGDGGASPGVVSAGNGTLTVSNSHVYTEEGNYALVVVLTDDSPGTASAVAADAIVVVDAPLSAAASAIKATEGTAFGGTVATFTDADPMPPLGNYTAQIDWGDHTTSAVPAADITSSAGVFSVPGNHTYAEQGTYTLTVTINDIGGSSATVQPLATVRDATLSATGVPVSAVEGAAFSGNVATFTDSDPGGSVGDYSAVIQWGDNTSSAVAQGNVTASGGVLAVPANHTYSEEGTYTATVTISDGGGAFAVVKPVAAVVDPSVRANALAVSATAGVPVTASVATFTDPGGAEVLSGYAATIFWGDGDVSAASISGPDNSGVFTVSGTNAYANSGTFTATVTISHDAAPAVTVSAPVTVIQPPKAVVSNTADQTPIIAGETAGFTIEIQNIGGSTASGLTLSDPLPAGAAGDINWQVDTSGIGLASATQPQDFSLVGATGGQQLLLSALVTTLPANASISVHITGQTTAADSGSLTNTATVNSLNEPLADQNAQATSKITVLGPGATVVGNNLYVVGGAGGDHVTIKPVGASNTGRTGIQAQGNAGGANVNAIYNQSLGTIYVFGAGGNEQIQIAPSITIAAVISARNGNDQVQLGDGKNRDVGQRKRQRPIGWGQQRRDAGRWQ